MIEEPEISDMTSQLTDLDVRSELSGISRSGRGRGRGSARLEEDLQSSTFSDSTSIHERSSSSNPTPKNSNSGGNSGKSQKSTDSEGTEKNFLREQKRQMQNVLDLVPKQAPGQRGQRIQLSSNFYKTRQAHSQLELFEYHFENGYEIEKNKYGKKISLEESMAFFKEWIKIADSDSSPNSSNSSSASSDHTTPPRAYFDGRSKIYTFEMIPEGEVIVPFRYQKHSGEFKARIKMTNDLSHIWRRSMERLQAGEAIDPIILHVKETILKHKFSLEHVKVGNTYYPEVTDANQHYIPRFDIAPGKVAWKGLNLTVSNTMGGLSLQAKTKAAVFYKPLPLLDFLAEMLNEGAIDQERVWASRGFRERAITACKGLQINVNSPAGCRSRKIMDITPDSAHMLRFKARDEHGNERSQNVADYYRNKHEPLKYPKLPCINTAGKKARPEFFPIEFCSIMGRQPVKGKLNDREVASMIKFASQPAPDTFKEISGAMAQKRKLFEQDFRVAGLEIDEKMVKADARILEEPKVNYANGAAQMRDGSWNPLRFVKPAQAKRWGCMFLETGNARFNPEQKIWDFSVMLQKIAQEMGMEFGDCAWVQGVGPRQIGDFLDWAKTEKLDFLLCVIDRKFSDYYPKIKAYAERTLDLLTQCLVLKNLERANPQLCKMLLAKINAKLGGYSCYVDLKLAIEEKSDAAGLFEVPVMIQALDINTTQTDGFAIATLASSFDENATSFNMVARTTSEPNFATKLEEMEQAALVNFYKLTREKPQAIIFFRPGVNEADMAHIMTLEIKAIMKACSELEDGYCPRVTYIVASKMHGTRFASSNRGLQIGKGHNLPAGTVVDTEITSCDKFDFYLQSSMGIQGTSIPTHYYVLHDDNRLDADSAQGLCYYLCHGFARCNRTISMPNAMKYAQLASARARNWCKEIPNANPREYEERVDNMLDTKYLVDRNGNKYGKKQKSQLYQSSFFF